MCIYLYIYILKKTHIYINLQITYTSPGRRNTQYIMLQQVIVHVKGRNGDNRTDGRKVAPAAAAQVSGGLDS